MDDTSEFGTNTEVSNASFGVTQVRFSVRNSPGQAMVRTL